MGEPRNLSTPEQKAALEKLDNAIREAWAAFGYSEPTDKDKEDDPTCGWDRTPVEDRMLGGWMVLLPVNGNEEDQIDIMWPEFPPMPMWQSIGLLESARDQMRP